MAKRSPGLDGPAERYERLHSTSKPSRRLGKDKDTRSAGQIDHDRILYTSAFRRLAGVTQVVGPLEGHIFHNRLTHTLEVSQLARRLAERLRGIDRRAVIQFGGLSPDVAEAAALAHDLGHPPFGHVAEKTLNELATQYGGFEGNAQSFRIITKLAAHRTGYAGLNLTRATLNAILKYPWFRGEGPRNKRAKFGAYRSESRDFRYARRRGQSPRQSLEAAVMDHADAIAYSVHDLDDFYRAGLIPLEAVPVRLDFEIEEFKKSGKLTPAIIERNRDSISRMWFYLRQISRRYEGTYRERLLLRAANSRLIDLFLSNVRVGDPRGTGSPLIVPEDVEVQMRFLQNLVWRYVITNPRLGTQQEGQRRIIRTLFSTYLEAIEAGNDGKPLIPPAYEQAAAEIQSLRPKSRARRGAETRLAIDIVASFTDNQATILYRRLTGVAGGSVTDLLEG